MRICGAGVCESGLEAANVSALRLEAAQSGGKLSAAYAPSCRQFVVCGGAPLFDCLTCRAAHQPPCPVLASRLPILLYSPLHPSILGHLLLPDCLHSTSLAGAQEGDPVSLDCNAFFVLMLACLFANFLDSLHHLRCRVGVHVTETFAMCQHLRVGMKRQSCGGSFDLDERVANALHAVRGAVARSAWGSSLRCVHWAALRQGTLRIHLPKPILS